MSPTTVSYDHCYPQLILVFIVLLVMFMMVMIRQYFKRAADDDGYLQLPPSPPNKLPILGHLLQLGIHPHRNLQILAQKHGPDDLMLLHLGHAPTLVVSSADWAREIMKTHDHVFASRPPSYFPKKLFYGKDFAFAPYGEYWKQIRKICILQLLSAKRIQLFRSVREEETAVMIDKINNCCSVGGSVPGRVVNLSEELMSLTSNIMCRAAFGRKYSCGSEDQAIIGKKFIEVLKEVIHLLGVFNVGDFIPWLAWLNHFNGLNRKLENTFREFDLLLEGVVQEHALRNKKTNGGGGSGRGDVDTSGEEDFVDVLLGIEKDGTLGRDNIKAIISDMFVAGSDTTFAVLEWAMAELIRDPKIMKEVQEEVRGIARGKPNVTENDLDKMHYLQSVIKETLRFHPPAPLMVPHESIEFVKLQGYDIPAKTRVIINAWAIGRDPKSWKEPEQFEPKRFLSSSTDYKGQHFEFIPFGAGRRGCPGMLFATSLIELGLANLLYRYDWALPDGAREDELDMAESGLGIVTHKKSPLLVVATDHLIDHT